LDRERNATEERISEEGEFKKGEKAWSRHFCRHEKKGLGGERRVKDAFTKGKKGKVSQKGS